MRSTRRNGFTLVELLVVIAIIGILVSLLLPAVQAAREAARRLSCKNNIKNVALAVALYEDSRKVFPAAGIVDTTPTNFNPLSGKMFSWITLVLPHLEQSQLYGRINFNTTVLNQPSNFQEQQIPILMCPSDAARDSYFSHPQLTNGRRFAKGNYAAYVSPFHTDLENVYPGALSGHVPRRAGFFTQEGTSSTLLLAEVRARVHGQDPRGVWALPWTGSTLLAFDLHHQNDPGPCNYPKGISARTFVPWSASTANQFPNNQGPNLDMLYSCPDPAGARVTRMPCNQYTLNSGFCYLSAAPRSQHTGGVMVAFLDGHVGFMSNQIDRRVMAFIISTSDGQPVDASEYVR